MTAKTKNLIALSGKTAAARTIAFTRIAADTYAQGESRGDYIANIRKALGTRPSAKALEVAQQEVQVGRIAFRLPAGELPKGCKADDAGARLEFARLLLTAYAAPAKGARANKLRKGQVGRRTEAQHKVVRASVEYWSQVKAELGLSGAMTQAEKNKAKRATPPAMAGSRQVSKPEPIAPEAMPDAKAMTAQTCVAFFTAQTATLEAFAKKYAGIIPLECSSLVDSLAGFRKAALEAANAYERRKAREDAEAAAKESEDA